jgi:hypothetical protein
LRPPFFLSLTLVALAASRQARADEAPIVLAIRPPALAGCPDAGSLARQINAVLARDAVTDAVPAGPHATIEIAFAAAPGGLDATLSLAGPDGASLGSRQLHHPGRSCAALAGPAAIVGALLVDVARTQISLSLPPPPPEPPPATRPPPAPPPVASAPPARRSVGARGEVAAAGVVGLLPGLALGARSELRARGVGAEGNAWPAWVTGKIEVFPSSVAPGPGPGGAFSLWTAGLGACVPAVEGTRVEIEGCAAGAAGAMHGVGTGARVVREVTGAVALIEAGGALRLRILGPLWARVAVEAATGRRPASFSFDRGGDPLVVHRPSPVWLVGTAGISIGE